MTATSQFTLSRLGALSRKKKINAEENQLDPHNSPCSFLNPSVYNLPRSFHPSIFHHPGFSPSLAGTLTSRLSQVPRALKQHHVKKEVTPNHAHTSRSRLHQTAPHPTSYPTAAKNPPHQKLRRHHHRAGHHRATCASSSSPYPQSAPSSMPNASPPPTPPQAMPTNSPRAPQKCG